MGTAGLFVPHVIAVYKHEYVYWFAQGLLGIRWNRFSDLTIEFFPIHNWELLIVSVWTGQIHAKKRIEM